MRVIDLMEARDYRKYQIWFGEAVRPLDQECDMGPSDQQSNGLV
jgi:hypothetical protein